MPHMYVLLAEHLTTQKKSTKSKQKDRLTLIVS